MNPKQEKRFWSADQKRFVYSLDPPLGEDFLYLLICHINTVKLKKEGEENDTKNDFTI